MATSTLFTKLHTTKMPNVTVWRNAAGTEPGNRLAIPQGKNTIKWQPVSAQDDDWAFNDVTGLPDPPFRKKTVEAQEIEIEDDNTDTHETSFPYTISVTKDCVTYFSDPQIINKPH